MLNTPSEAITKLGGSKVVSAQIDRPPTTVGSWATRQSIPVDAWTKLVALAELRGVREVTYESLAQAHARKGQKAPTKPKRKRAA